MPKTPLFANWTWKLTMPEPFDKITSNTSTTYYSTYCTVATKKSTLHSPLLAAVLAYMEMDTSLTPGSSSESAIGTQGEKTVAEYQSRTGEIHVAVFNRKNGKFNVGRYEDVTASPKVYSLKDGGSIGTALFFVLIPEAMKDDEFKENYDLLGKCKNDGYADMDEAEKAAFILCDNLYRRIEGADALPTAGIKLNIPNTGNLPQLTAVNISRNAYSPSSVLYGTFRILTGTAAHAAAASVNRDDFVKHYPLSDRVLTPKEELMVPRIEDWYVIPPEVTTICRHAQMTTAGSQPMRNFMMRGPAGTGKTESAKAVEYPTLTDIQMDPPSAYKKLTGTYDEAITDAEVYDKLLEVMAQDAKALMADNASGQRFRYVETPLITAIRNGYLIEIQEPTVIANPGVLVGLNALLDRCASVTLTTGEVIHRHPDTVVVVTTNNNYAGCRDMNQSVISRMNLIMDIEEPDVDTLTERVMKVTGCTDRSAVSDMAASVQEISERCRETMINDGSCGVRELISWVQSYMVCGSVLEAAKYTVLSSVSGDPENRADILSSCLEQKFAA